MPRTALLLVLLALPTATRQSFQLDHRSVPPLRTAAESIATGDLDGDGTTDVVIGTNTAPNVLLLNDGLGHFEHAPLAMPVHDDLTHGIAVADVDGDGDDDLLLANVSLNRVLVNDGSGVFSEPPGLLPPLNDLTLCVDTADVDGDGDVDAFFGNWEAFGATDTLAYNDGTGVFTKLPNTIPDDGQLTQACRFADWNGDLSPDLFLGNLNDRIYLNDGSGRFFAPPGALPAIADDTRAALVDDVDGDGDLDILVATANAGDRLLLNDGTGTFADGSAQLPAGLDFTIALAGGDVDGDGDDDVVVIDPLVDDLVLQNDGAGTFTVAATLASTVDTAAGALFDANGDDDLDLFLGFEAWQQDQLWFNDGSGALTDVTTFGTSELESQALSTVSIAVGDLNGDGREDVFEGNLAPGTQRVLENRGANLFAAFPGALPTAADLLRDVELGDVNGDGAPDAVLFREGTGPFGSGAGEVWLGDGSGGFARGGSPIPGTDFAPWDGELFDFDGDGDLDAFAAVDEDSPYSAGGLNTLFLGDGTGAFAYGPPPPGGADGSRCVEAGDVDLDGDLDVVVANRPVCTPGCGGVSGGRTQLLLNAGGVLVESNALPPDADRSSTLALFDVDGDGDLDVHVGNEQAVPDRLYLNGAAGGPLGFVDGSAQLPAVATFPTDTEVADVDGDGDADLLVANGDEPPILLLNDGAGVFANGSALLPEIQDHVFAVATLDADGDGDRDVLLATSRANLLLANRARHVAADAVAGIGNTLRIGITGGVGESWVLAVAGGPAAVPLPPFGVLELDPATLFVLSAGLTGGGGDARSDHALPADGSLVGQTLHLQAGLFGQLAFTNREEVVLTDL